MAASEHWARAHAAPLALPDFSTTVHSDGLGMTLLLRGAAGIFRVEMSASEVERLHAEIGQAALLMLWRQSQATARETDPLRRLAADASLPVRVTPLLDRASGDRIFIHEFSDRLPYTFRMSPSFMAELCVRVSRTIGTGSH